MTSINLATRHTLVHVTPDEITHPTIDQQLQELLAWANSRETVYARMLATRHVFARLRAASEDATAQTRTIAREMHEMGWSLSEISALVGRSRARVQQWIAEEG